MKLFEVFIIEGQDASNILSPEVLAETGAQIMTPAEAAFVGLEGIPDDPEGRPRVLVACQPADERLITSRLEAHAAVGGFKLHVIG
ncbi:MAG: hypothetical protein JRI68_26445 [Deltaproteobacteria bacterium]|nr:hypothetical protein [Deltaproteobacteria bacterium]